MGESSNFVTLCVRQPLPFIQSFVSYYTAAAEVLNEPNPYIRSVATAVGVTIASQNDADVHELSALCFKMGGKLSVGALLSACTEAEC